jgi:hypothetical protein
MTISEQLALIKDGLADWASNHKGSVSITSDLRHMWKMAGTGSETTQLMLVYFGEQPMGDVDTRGVLGRVKRQFNALLVRGRGFSAERGDSVPDFTVIIEDARDTIRGLHGLSAEPPVEVDSIKPVFVQDAPTDSYLIEFSISTDIEQFDYRTTPE